MREGSDVQDRRRRFLGIFALIVLSAFLDAWDCKAGSYEDRARCQAASAHLSQEWSRLGQKLSRDWAGLKDRALGTGWHNITVYDEGIQVKGQLFTGWDVVRDRLDNHGYGIANDQLREHLLDLGAVDGGHWR